MVMSRVLLLAVFVAAVLGSSGRVRMSELKAITLHAGQPTQYHRTHSVPQLRCISGACHVKIETVRCIHEGNEQWTCKTNDMPAGVRFGRVSVLCEGYDYPDDPYVTEGSCGLEYSLLGAPHSNDFHGGSHDPRLGPRYARESRVGGGVGLLTVFFVLVFIWIVYKSCGQQIMAPPANYGGGGPAGGGGGGPGPGCGPGMGMGMGGQGMGGGGAGFWTGAGMGGGLGYMAGRMFGGGGGYQQGYNRRNAANEGRFGPFGYEPAPGEQTRGYTPQRTQQPTTQTAYADTRRR